MKSRLNKLSLDKHSSFWKKEFRPEKQFFSGSTLKGRICPWSANSFIKNRLPLRRGPKKKLADLLSLSVHVYPFTSKLNHFELHLSLMSLKFLSFTLKAPITTAADDIHKYFFIVFFFRKKYDLMFQVNPLLDRGFT